MDVLIFTTNVTEIDEVIDVTPLLKAVPSIKEWNFDLEDCDRILRIVADDISPRFIEVLMQNAGFSCMELEY